MAAPRQGGFPPLFWIILAGLAVCLAVFAYFAFTGTTRQGVNADVSTPMHRGLDGVNEPATSTSANPGSPTVPSAVQSPDAQAAPARPATPDDVRPGVDTAPPPGSAETRGSPVPHSDPDAD